MHKILIEVDKSCEMACVSLNDKCVMMGNNWDFHPGCHGISEYGDFKGYHSLAIAIQNKVGGEIIIDREWKYE